jgi:hypothetical protein
VSELILFDERSSRRAAQVLDGTKVGLVRAALRWKPFRLWTSSLPLGTCQLCSAQFTEGVGPGLNSEYSVVGGGPASQDDYRGICAIRHDLGRDELGWTVLDTRGHTALAPSVDDALRLPEFPLGETLDQDDTREPSTPPPYRW